MALQLDVLGFRYDDSEPAFTLLTGGLFYYHFASAKEYEKTSFDAWMTKQGKTFGAKELGAPSAAYLAQHNTIASRVGAPSTPPPTGAPITASVTKAPTTTADDTGTITVAGGPADKAYTITVTVKDKASSGDDVMNIPVAKGATAAKAAADIAAGVSDPNITAAASGAVVTFTPKTGSYVEKLTVSVA
jgi:hypothetical protein